MEYNVEKCWLSKTEENGRKSYEEHFICSFRMCAIYQNRGLADVVGSLPKYFDKKKYVCGWYFRSIPV